MRSYLAHLTPGLAILWCYLIWYLVALILYFDPSPQLWGTAAGVALLVGFGLLFSSTPFPHAPVGLSRWQVSRFFMMPFAVSSFSGLAKDRGFVLILFPESRQTLFACACCATFCLARWGARRCAGETR